MKNNQHIIQLLFEFISTKTKYNYALHIVYIYICEINNRDRYTLDFSVFRTQR
jgi:hypothetical protein